MNSAKGDFSFILNLDGVETKTFPPEFLIEFFNKNTKPEKILPYYYAEFVTFETYEKQKEPEPEPQPQPEPGPGPEPQPEPNVYTIDYNLDDGKTATDNPTSYTAETESFTLVNPTKTGYYFKSY